MKYMDEFRDGGLARVELHLHELHLVAVQLEVDVMGAAARRRAEREFEKQYRMLAEEEAWKNT